MLHQQFVVGAFLDGAGDALPVLRPQRQRAQDQQVEGSLQQRQAVGSRVGI